MLLYLISGDAYTEERALTVNVTDKDGDPLDISETDLVFAVCARPGVELFRKTLGEGVTRADQMSDPGVAYIEIEPEDTEDLAGRYLWELQGTDPVGVVTLAGGSIYIKSDLVAAS